MKCPKCGSSEWVIVYHTYNFCNNIECNTVWTRWQQAEIDRLKLKWETGRPIKGKYYWIKYKYVDGTFAEPYITKIDFPQKYDDKDIQFSGPIPDPE